MVVRIILPIKMDGRPAGEATKTVELPDAPVAFDVVVFVGIERFSSPLDALAWEENVGFVLRMEEKVLVAPSEPHNPLAAQPHEEFIAQLKTSGWTFPA